MYSHTSYFTQSDIDSNLIFYNQVNYVLITPAYNNFSFLNNALF